ncbi:MAG: AAA family ATPase [Oscillospiraceae bacterium]|nr:AAA family ATPase [Oscillospiraceae bacterium]
MNDNWKTLCGVVPKPPDWNINWDALFSTPIAPYLERLSKTEQNPEWHAEGNVLIHTKMVCEELAEDSEFRELPKEKREILFIAALMHDFGKISCTVMEDGIWKSPSHTIVGSKMAREILWKDFSLAGTKEEQEARECICNLIRYHSVPVHIAEQKNPELRLYQIAAQGELVPGFSLQLLSILVRADLKGRICDTIGESLDSMELCFMMSKDEGIFDKPGVFVSDAAEYAYLSGKNVWKGQDVYDDTWGEVILMSGLPGTGKDTWIKEHYPDMPMISLDDIRKEMNISPTEKQGQVVQEARERARAYLRSKQPFVWNATNLSAMLRHNQLSLFEQYHARTRIVFLETPWDTNLSRNENRSDAVPTIEIEHMMRNLELPTRTEARAVEWHCV